MDKNKKKTSVEAEVMSEPEQSKAIIARKTQAVNFNAETLISQAIEKGVSVDTMERLLAMRRELKAEFAKEAFDKAMAKFQAECPTIVKTKEVKTKSGIVAYRYAPIESIVEQVKTPLQNNGFSYSTKQEMLDSGVKISVKVTHSAGHSEVTEMTVPLGTKTDIMSQSQVVAAASTFAKRYAFCNAFGILTGDEDTDARPMETNEVQKEKVFPPTDKQMETIRKNMEEKSITEADLITEGFPPLKDLTGGKEGTASEIIGYLFSISKFSNGLKGPTEEDILVNSLIKKLEASNTVAEYEDVCSEIRVAKEEGKLNTGYSMLVKVCKVAVQRIQGVGLTSVSSGQPLDAGMQKMKDAMEKAKQTNK